MKVQVGHASLPKVGELANGDRPFFRQNEQQQSLLAVIDGLGHGPEAEVAALAALRYLSEVSLDTSLEQLMPSLHDSMRGTRGSLWALWALFLGALGLELVFAERLALLRPRVWHDAQAGVWGFVLSLFAIAIAVWTFALRESLAMRDVRTGALDPQTPAGFSRIRRMAEMGGE